MDLINLIRLFLEVIGGITTLISLIIFILAVISWFLGVYPLFVRLGFSRWSRKIAIVADSQAYASLKSDLVDTGIFREKNIFQISDSSLSKVKTSSLILVNYQSFTENEIKTILSYKKPTAGVIIYFPGFSNTNRIADDIRDLINNEPFTTTVNFRGRLINDILVTLLSTSYEKK